MSYYFAKTLTGSFDAIVARTKEALSHEGFGVLTEIDVAGTMKKKLDEDMPAYRILGACHPRSAFRALQAENKIGTMLPCNVIVRQTAAGSDAIEVAAVDPIASMSAVDNPVLGDVAGGVRDALKRVVDSL